MKQIISHDGGFTLVELVMAIVIIGIMASLIVFVPAKLRDSGEDQERVDDAESIARQLELSYNNQALGTPTYPSTVEMSDDILNKTRTMKGADSAMFESPGATSSSVVAATSSSQATPLSTGVTKSTYVYQPLKRDGTLCTSANSAASAAEYCVRFFLYYYAVTKSAVYKLSSVHQQ